MVQVPNVQVLLRKCYMTNMFANWDAVNFIQGSAVEEYRECTFLLQPKAIAPLLCSRKHRGIRHHDRGRL